MDNQTALNHKFAVIGWGTLFIWWGIVVMINPLTIGMGAIGTGIILFAINFARSRAGIWNAATRRSNAIVGTIAILWGSLDTIRHALGWDAGASFALLLLVVGVVFVGSILFPAERKDASEVG